MSARDVPRIVASAEMHGEWTDMAAVYRRGAIDSVPVPVHGAIDTMRAGDNDSLWASSTVRVGTTWRRTGTRYTVVPTTPCGTGWAYARGLGWRTRCTTTGARARTERRRGAVTKMVVETRWGWRRIRVGVIANRGVERGIEVWMMSG